MIPQAFIDDLINRIDIVEFIQNYVQLKKQGQNFVACCPFHQEKTPSFSVSATKQIYHCFGCGVGGNVVSFLMEYDRLSFPDAIAELARHAGVEVPQSTDKPSEKNSRNDYDVLEEVSQFYQRQLRQHTNAEQVISYLKNRGISGKIAKLYGLGYAPDAWQAVTEQYQRDKTKLESLLATGMVIKNDRGRLYDRFRGRLMFPIRNRRGQTIGFGGRVLDPNDNPKYLNSSDSAIFHKGRELYGLHETYQLNRQFKQLIVVEGYMDVIALAQHGLAGAVATLGTATTPDHVQQLLRHSSQIVFCFDGDTAGKAAAWRAMENCLAKLRQDSNIKFLLLPEGEDPDTMIQQEGLTGFTTRIQQALGLAEYFIQQLTTQYDVSSLAGKSQIISVAKRLLTQMSNIPLKQIMMDELAAALHLPPDRLPKLLRDSTDSVPVSSRLQEIATPLRMAMVLLVQNPGFIDAVPENFVIQQQPGSQTMQDIIRSLRTGKRSTASLFEAWRDHPNLNLLQELAQFEHPIPEQGMQQEFSDLLTHLSQQQHQQLNDLLRLAKTRPLSEEEKRLLQQLIQQKQCKEE